MEDRILQEFILRSIKEDIGEGDHSSLACISKNADGEARLLVKEKGILAGVRIAEQVFSLIDNQLKFEVLLNDGAIMWLLLFQEDSNPFLCLNVLS
jgi:nicotinate-nucleotide pyrophosphorylase (carboxylating)